MVDTPTQQTVPFNPPTQTNPPFTSPPTWPFPTTSTDWEDDYRLRLLEAALMYIWTTGGAIGGGCVAVGSTAPPHDGSTIAPPEGFLWVDTSTQTGPPAAYVPPQTPPASGFNTFTDSSGTVWVSYNGTAWKTAQNALHAKYHRNAAWTPSGTPLPLSMDALDYDNYGLMTGGGYNFTCPLAGIWRIRWQACAVASSVPNWQQVQVTLLPSTPLAIGTITIAQASANSITTIEQEGPMTVGQQWQIQISGGGGTTGVTGAAYTFMTIDYVGTG